MRAKHFPTIEGFFYSRMRSVSHPQRQRPLCTVKVLRLHGAKPPHNVRRLLEGWERKLLIAKAQIDWEHRLLTRAHLIHIERVRNLSGRQHQQPLSVQTESHERRAGFETKPGLRVSGA